MGQTDSQVLKPTDATRPSRLDLPYSSTTLTVHLWRGTGGNMEGEISENARRLPLGARDTAGAAPLNRSRGKKLVRAHPERDNYG